MKDVNRIREGGPRKHIPKEIRDKFIHAVLLMPEAADRQAEVDTIFDEIKQANIEAWMKAHPEMSKSDAEDEVTEKMTDQIGDKLNEWFKLTDYEAKVEKRIREDLGDDWTPEELELFEDDEMTPEEYTKYILGGENDIDDEEDTIEYCDLDDDNELRFNGADRLSMENIDD